ncbi:MAG: SDR family oxidoreductase [Microcoleus sp. SIO2G3]|nr:SDR family oxidoreductase [Microcoleus sp. SIO2G3]
METNGEPINSTETNNTNRKSTKGLTRRRVMLGGAGIVGVATAIATQNAQANTQNPPEPEATLNPDGRFAGKVVLITGATSGIGAGTARAFAMEGATVHFCGRRENLGKQVADAITAAGGKATYQKADVRNEAEVKAFVDECVSRYGRIDIAFNNAGIDRPPAPLADTTTEVWDDTINTNLRGIFLAMKYEIPQMLKQNGGHIVNMSSLGGHRAFAGIAPYHASKFAIEAITKVAAKDYAKQNIRVNAIAPGLVDTPMTERQVRDWKVTREQLAANYAIDRISTVEEQVRVVMFMCSPEASYMTGAIVSVDGGGWG